MEKVLIQFQVEVPSGSQQLHFKDLAERINSAVNGDMLHPQEDQIAVGSFMILRQIF